MIHSVSADTQKGVIVKFLSEHPEDWFLTYEFCRGPGSDHFVGYKAQQRISELRRIGVVIGRPSKEKSKWGGKFHEYRLNPHVSASLNVETNRYEVYRPEEKSGTFVGKLFGKK